MRNTTNSRQAGIIFATTLLIGWASWFAIYGFAGSPRLQSDHYPGLSTLVSIAPETTGQDSEHTSNGTVPSDTTALQDPARQPLAKIEGTGGGPHALSMDQRYEAYSSTFNDRETYQKFRENFHEAMALTYGPGEADFLTKLLGVSDWETAKELINERSRVSGKQYNELKLKIGLASGQITTDELLDIAYSGTALPDNTIHKLARTGQFESIRALTSRGFISNVNLVNPLTGQNALGYAVTQIGINADNYSPAQASAAVTSLIAMGVEPMPVSGSTDHLSSILSRVRANNVDVKLAMADALLRSGVPLQRRHINMMRALPKGPTKEKVVKFFANNS